MNSKITNISYSISKHKVDDRLIKGLKDILTYVKDKFGFNQTFSIEIGNFTSDEYGSYRLIFKNKNTNITTCTVIWDAIFGEVKIYKGGNNEPK